MTGVERGREGCSGSEPRASERTATRRELLVSGLVALGSVAGCLGGGSPQRGWRTVETPTRKGLNDAVMTVDGPYAVGKSGLVLARRGDEWRTVVEEGPNGGSNTLEAADVTDDGQTMWTAGDSGALGRYDAMAGEMEDFTAPREKTSPWAGVAVDGKTDSERLFLVNGSGELLPGRWTNAGIKWGEVTKPTGGESATAVDVADGVAYVADTAGGVYRRSEMGSGEWSAVGIRDVDTELHDLAAVDGSLLNAAADEGSIYVYNGYNWLQLRAGETTLHAIDRERGRGLAVGNDGTVHAIEENNWTTDSTPTSKTLHGCTLGTSSYADVVVGSDGLVLERFG